jgi:hypothetical protein
MDSQKEVYHLWVEYLKRSEAYQRFCDYVRARRDDPSVPVPEGLGGDKDGCPNPLVGVYLSFGDIFSYPFNEWWKWKSPFLAGNHERRSEGTVQDYLTGSASIEKDLDGCIDSFKRYEGREPTAEEMKRYFLQILEQQTRERHMLFLRVNLTGKPQGVYAPYYVPKSIVNRASDFFSLTIYDKKSIFCHIWKQEASHPQ